MSAVAGTGSAGAAADRRHGRRIALIWAIATAISVPIMIWVIGPHIPPKGGVSSAASQQHDVNVVLSALSMPVVMFIWVYFGYAAAVFRERGEEVVDGPPLEGEPRLQLVWLVATTLIVLALAVYGTVALFGEQGAGGGEGPNPIAKPAAAELRNALQVQVIGQQWAWTFRFPGYGGVETAALELPVNRQIVFHVTSLDVAHSFWVYELGVKADAVPGNDNVAYMKPTQLRKFQVRCAELCGLWHGHMNLFGRVVSDSAFSAWIAQERITNARVTKYLPPVSKTYYPEPLRRAG